MGAVRRVYMSMSPAAAASHVIGGATLRTRSNPGLRMALCGGPTTRRAPLSREDALLTTLSHGPSSLSHLQVGGVALVRRHDQRRVPLAAHCDRGTQTARALSQVHARRQRQRRRQDTMRGRHLDTACQTELRGTLAAPSLAFAHLHGIPNTADVRRLLQTSVRPSSMRASGGWMPSATLVRHCAPTTYGCAQRG